MIRLCSFVAVCLAVGLIALSPGGRADDRKKADAPKAEKADPAKELAAMAPKGLILSGGPASVYATDAPLPDRANLPLWLVVVMLVNIGLFAALAAGLALALVERRPREAIDSRRLSMEPGR